MSREAGVPEMAGWRGGDRRMSREAGVPEMAGRPGGDHGMSREREERRLMKGKAE